MSLINKILFYLKVLLTLLILILIFYECEGGNLMSKARNLKIFSIILTICLACSLFAGCGGSKDTTTNSGDSSKPTESKKEVTLTYAVWDKNQEPIYRQVADEFQKKFPNIKIKIELTPYKQYWTKLETEASAGNMNDVFWMNGPRFGKYAKGGILKPITDNIKKANIDLNQYPKGLVDLYTFNGQNYAIPKDWDTSALWYNKVLFDNAKVPYPDDTWDWTKLRDAAKKLTDTKKGVYGIAAPQEDQCGYYNTILANGGFVISNDKKTSGYDKPESIAGVQCWIDLIKDGSSPSAQEMTETSPGNLFQSGKVAMTYQGSWMIPEFMNNEYTKDKVNLVQMPKLKSKGAVIHGLGNMIYAKTKNAEEAWEFVKYLGEKEANEIVAKSGVVIPAFKPVLNTFIQSNTKINLKAYVDCLDYAQMYPSSIETAKWNEIEGKYMKQIWAGEISAEEGCKKIATEMNAVLATEK